MCAFQEDSSWSAFEDLPTLIEGFDESEFVEKRQEVPHSAMQGHFGVVGQLPGLPESELSSATASELPSLGASAAGSVSQLPASGRGAASSQLAPPTLPQLPRLRAKDPSSAAARTASRPLLVSGVSQLSVGKQPEAIDRPDYRMEASGYASSQPQQLSDAEKGQAQLNNLQRRAAMDDLDSEMYGGFKFEKGYDPFE